MGYEDFKIYLEEQFLIKYFHIGILELNYLLLLKIQKTKDINVNLLQWFINFLIKYVLILILYVVLLNAKLCETRILLRHN